MKHSELPWEWDGKPWDYDPQEEAPWIVEKNSSGKAVLTGEIKCSKANAAFIVKAANNHYKLLEALKNLLAANGGGSKLCGHDFTCCCPYDLAKQAIKEAE